MHICDTFYILQYDFKNQKAQLYQPGVEPFWASTEWLTEDDREELRVLTSSAIENRTIAEQNMALSCKIKKYKIISSVIKHIKSVDFSNAGDLKSALLKPRKKVCKAKQLSLFE